MAAFDQLLASLPNDKRKIKAHISALAALPVRDDAVELYPILQACSFGGKQISRAGDRWENAFFRDYWEPTDTSVRRSPANPMQPSPTELRRRINAIVNGMKGVTCLHTDIMDILTHPLPPNSVVYVDPPYEGTTGYAFGFDIMSFAARFRELNSAPLFISEKTPLTEDALLLTSYGPKGGITGTRKGNHQEWLSRF